MALEVVFLLNRITTSSVQVTATKATRTELFCGISLKVCVSQLPGPWFAVGRHTAPPPGPGYSRGAVMIRFSCQFSPRNRVYLGRSVGHSPCKYSAGYFPRPDNFHPHLEYSPRLERRKVESYHQSVLPTISVVQLPMLYTLTVDWLADGDDGRGERLTNLLITNC